MQAVFIFIAGFIIGILATNFIYRKKHVGTLRIDNSDPSDGTYFFLEVDSGKADHIPKQKSILLNVSTKNYIPQE